MFSSTTKPRASQKSTPSKQPNKVVNKSASKPTDVNKSRPKPAPRLRPRFSKEVPTSRQLNRSDKLGPEIYTEDSTGIVDKLPFDILLIVFSHLRNDTVLLWDCLTVCKAFKEAVLPSLYEKIVLKYLKDYPEVSHVFGFFPLLFRLNIERH
jgi:hypothetical protein